MAVPLERKIDRRPPAIFIDIDPEALLDGYRPDGHSPDGHEPAGQDGRVIAGEEGLTEDDRPDLERSLVATLHAVLGKRQELERERESQRLTLGRGSLELVMQAKDRLAPRPRTVRSDTGTNRR